MNFEIKLIGQNLLVLAIIWAVLLTIPALGYTFIAVAAIVAWNCPDPDAATGNWIGIGVGLMMWTLAMAWPMVAGWIMTTTTLLNVAVLIWLRHPKLAATQ